jgi:hypothetical protein
VSPIALTATTTSLPALRVSTMRFATRLMLSASATEDPPNFCTIKLTVAAPGGGWQDEGRRVERGRLRPTILGGARPV